MNTLSTLSETWSSLGKNRNVRVHRPLHLNAHVGQRAVPACDRRGQKPTAVRETEATFTGGTCDSSRITLVPIASIAATGTVAPEND